MFGYKCKITTDQFFKYGYAESKMLLCCDVIALVKQKHRQLRIKRSLSAKRVMTTRPADGGRYSLLNHSQGRQSNFLFERDPQVKEARVGSLQRDFNASSRSLRSAGSRGSLSLSRQPRRANLDLPQAASSTEKRERSGSGARYCSFEAFMRLTGSQAFQPVNRYRIEPHKPADKQTAEAEAEAKKAVDKLSQS